MATEKPSTDNDGGIRVVNEVESLQRIAADLQADPRLDETGRQVVIGELDDWMFTRPIRAGLKAAMGFERVQPSA